MHKPDSFRGRRDVSPVDRFWTKVDKTGGCWIWRSQINHDGYGHFSLNGNKIRAHRYSWELAYGPIPEKSLIDHACRNRACVNPDHLRLATNGQNMENQAGPHRGNSTGYLGVGLDKRRNRYYARVIKDKQFHWGGYFATAEAASEVAKEMRLSLFTHNDADRVA